MPPMRPCLTRSLVRHTPFRGNRFQNTPWDGCDHLLSDVIDVMNTHESLRVAWSILMHSCATNARVAHEGLTSFRRTPRESGLR